MRCFAKRRASSAPAVPALGPFHRKPLFAALAAAAIVGVFGLANPVFAQNATQSAAPATAPASAASKAASNAAGTPNDAARRAADSPYRWILINSTAPGKPKTASAAATATAAADAAPVAAAPAPTRRTRAEVQEAAAATAAANAAAANAPATNSAAASVRAAEAAPAPVPAPAPVTVAAAPPPPPPPVVREPLPLVPVKQEQPQLSSAVLRDSPNGLVKVAFIVNADGSTSDAKIATSTNRRLNSAVLAAVAQWRYQPIEAPRSTEVEMSFKLE